MDPYRRTRGAAARGGGAEHNLIQAPELVRKLARRLGLRQPHVAPALSEGVQPVIILDDLREKDLAEGDRYGYVAGGNVSALIGERPSFELHNSSNITAAVFNPTIIRVHRIKLGSNSANANENVSIGMSTAPLAATELTTSSAFGGRYTDPSEASSLNEPIAFRVGGTTAAQFSNPIYFTTWPNPFVELEIILDPPLVIQPGYTLRGGFTGVGIRQLQASLSVSFRTQR